MSLDIGQVLGGKFLIERLVGRGTMGCVWQARDQGNQQRIAIRLIQPEFDNEQVAAYVEADGRRVGQLSNRHLVKQLNVGFLPTGERCILSEFADGETLKSRIANKGPLSEIEVAQLLVQSLEGLDAAHEAGVIHRDLTPRSILLVPTAGGAGQVAALIDFGISRLQALTGNHIAAVAAGIETSSLQYLAPEQLNGLREIDPRSNIYSMGVVAYEAITGRLPFEGRDFSDPSVAILGEEPIAVEELAPESSSPFAQLIRKAMSRSPNARFQHAEEMIGAIINWATRVGITQAQLEAGIGTVQKRVVVPFLTQDPGADATAPSARFVPPSMPGAGSSPVATEPVRAPGSAPTAAVAPVVAQVQTAAPVPVVPSAPAQVAAATPWDASPVAALVPRVDVAPTVGAEPDIFGAPPAGDIDQSHVDALFGAPPVSARAEPQATGTNDWAQPAAAPPELGSSPLADGGVLVAPTPPQQNWQAVLETVPSGALQPPPYDSAAAAPPAAVAAQPVAEWTSPVATQPTEQLVAPTVVTAPTQFQAVPSAFAGPAPVAVVEDRSTPPQILLEMPTQRQTEPPVAPAADVASAPVAIVVQPVAPPADVTGAGTPAYGTPAVQPGPALVPQEGAPTQASPSPELAAEQAIRDKRTILGIGGAPGYPAAASAVVVPSVNGAVPASQWPQQMMAPGLQPADAAQAPAPQPTQSAPAAASAPQAAQAVPAAASAPQQQPKIAAQPAAAPAVAAPALPSPYEAPYPSAPPRSKKPLLIGVGLVAVVGIVAAIALSLGKAEPEVNGPAAASQSAPVPRTFEPLPPGPVAAAIAAASARAEASAKEPPASSPKSGASLSQAVNAGLMSQSVPAAQKSSKPAASTKAPPPAAKPLPPPAKPATAAAKPATAAPTPNKPVSRPAPAGDPYNYR